MAGVMTPKKFLKLLGMPFKERRKILKKYRVFAKTQARANKNANAGEKLSDIMIS